MPELVVLYATSGEKHEVYLLRDLARRLTQELPEMVVAAFEGVSWLEPREMSIDVRGYDPGAYNVAHLAVRMSLSRGVDDKVFNARHKIRASLKESVAIWLRMTMQERQINYDFTRDGIDVNLIFADMCGINMNVDGSKRSSWG